MNKNQYIRENFGIDNSVLELIDSAEQNIKEQFESIEETSHINQTKVLKAFQSNKVGDIHFGTTTGYGNDDIGRDALDKIYAQIFDCEDALVRFNFVSGTHTISTALFGVLRPGDLLVSITGKPYDTLDEVIGISGKKGTGSLADFGIGYMQIDLNNNGEPDYDKIKEIVSENSVKAVMLQRSKGYGDRPTYSPKKLGEIIKFVKSVSPKTIAIVDNCYGEFTDIYEPTTFGADLIMGSLIKNPGGGIAKTGGYIAGRKDLIELCSYRLTSVGIGKENGATLGTNRDMYQGLFMAPHIVSQATKTSVLAAAVYEKLGFRVNPMPKEPRYDIIQSITLGSAEKMLAFMRGVQMGAPVDSFVIPEAWQMPGYSDSVVMAAGAFVQGSSIEFSADGPLKPPYIAYLQGGLTYESARFGILKTVQLMKEKGLIELK